MFEPLADLATLKQWKADAAAAYQAVVTGGKAELVSYSQGEAHRSVTYTRSNLAALREWMQTLDQQIAQLSGRPGRRPVQPIWE